MHFFENKADPSLYKQHKFFDSVVHTFFYQHACFIICSFYHLLVYMYIFILFEHLHTYACIFVYKTVLRIL